jgi:hypothetical protein
VQKLKSAQGLYNWPQVFLTLIPSIKWALDFIRFPYFADIIFKKDFGAKDNVTL